MNGKEILEALLQDIMSGVFSEDGKLPSARTATPQLTTISQPVIKIAATAFKTLLARIRYPNNDPREIYLVAPLVARQSV